MMSSFPQKIKIVEVGPRDGLQNEKNIIPTADKIRFIDLLSESGLSVIEVSSFVHPKWVPQLADVADVYTKISKKPGVKYPCLVPNMKGLERAISLGVKEIAIFTAASETFNKKNINMSIAESLSGIREVVASARAHQMWVRGYVSTGFVCPYEGKIVPEKVVPVMEELLSLGIDELSLGDTIGAATPDDVEILLDLLLKKIPSEKLALHFHDTQGRAIQNILKSLEMGVWIYDSSAGGLGGCPYAPGASGNISTELLLEKINELGLEADVSLSKVSEASTYVKSVIHKAVV